MKNKIVLALLLSFTFSSAALADGHYNHDHDDHEFTEDLDYTYSFKDGTPNVLSPYVDPADTSNMSFAHNFFYETLPRGSNPAFFLDYSIMKNLDVDIVTSLRDAEIIPVELEIGTKYQFMNEYEGDFLSFAPRISYNTRGNTVGLDLLASKYILKDVWNVGLDYRVLSQGKTDGVDTVVQGIGISSMVRVWKHWHLFGDIVLPFSFNQNIIADKSFVWSAGLKKRIPHTPHILNLYVGNYQEYTTLGRTIPTGKNALSVFRAGFSFSIKIPAASKLPARLF